jgi:hypothetical protein
MVANEIDVLNVPTEGYPCFGSEEVYQRSVDIAYELFPDMKYLGVGPKFFEIYKNMKSEGIIVDAQDLEIKLCNPNDYVDAEKLMYKFKEFGLNYMICFHPKK